MSATFQCELKQWSPIIQHSSGGFKDQHTLLPAQKAQTHLLVPISSCKVVNMPFSSPCKTTPVPVSAKMHSRARISAAAICVRVYVCFPYVPPVYWFTVSALGPHDWEQVALLCTTQPPNRHVKKKTHSQTHLCLHPEDTLPDLRVMHTQVNQAQNYHTQSFYVI